MTDLHPILAGYIAWIKAHEKLVALGLGAFLIFHLYGGVLNLWERHDQRNFTIAQTTAQVAQQKVQTDNQQNQQLLQQLADIQAQYAALKVQLQTSLNKRQEVTVEQKQKDDQSTLTELAGRITTILRAQPKEIVADASGSTVTMSSSAAHADVNALEDGLQAEADKLDIDKQLTVCNTVVDQQGKSITGLQGQLKDEQTSHLADVKKDAEQLQIAKDEQKKEFRKGFKWGSIATLAATIAIKIATIVH